MEGNDASISLPVWNISFSWVLSPKLISTKCWSSNERFLNFISSKTWRWRSTQNAYMQGNGLWLRGQCLYRGVLEWEMWWWREGLKQLHLSHSFHWPGIQTQFSWVLWLRFFHEAAIKMLARLKAQLVKDLIPSPLMWSLAGSSRWAVGLRALVPCWLEPGGCLSPVPCLHGPLQDAPRNVAFDLHQSEQVKRASERMTARGKSQSWSLNWHPITWTIFCSLETSH